MGQLTLITLPIGNLGDLTERARKKLENADFFLAEDTRMLRSLLKHLDISEQGKSIHSFHEHSSDKIHWAMEQLELREEVCLVSDAGSPMVSDPAFPVVLKALSKGHKLETCPGVSSVITALELSGLPPLPFHFHGFLPREKGKRKQFLESLTETNGTHIFFESPHRVLDSLDQIVEVFPNGDMAVARELTKKFESVHRFKAEGLKSEKERIAVKGEFVLLVHHSKKNVQAEGRHDELFSLASQYMDSKRTPKQLAKLLGAILERPTSDIYQELGRK